MYSVKIFVLLVKQMGMATYFKKKKKKIPGKLARPRIERERLESGDGT